MWMDEIILNTSISADGSSNPVSQELRLSVDDGTVFLQCKGLFSVGMSYSEFANLAECVETLQKLVDDSEE